MKPHTAGDPMSGLKWTRKTTAKISKELRRAGIDVSRNTVGRLLQSLNYSLRVNHKKIARCSPLQRDRQFRLIRRRRRRFARAGTPVISVDTKKKELVGRFKNPGAVYATTPRLVKDHDFRSEAKGLAVPYGIYDTVANRGHLFIGTSHDTSAFAVTALARWWMSDGRKRYPEAYSLLILADNGGGNSSTCRAWKFELQKRFCNRFNIAVTVCHYPPGTSKWNPIEHRLFSEISKNWAGEPLETYDTILKFIRTTTTETGLRVRGTLIRGEFPTGVKITKEQVAGISLRPSRVLPQWNYTVTPEAMKM